MMSQWLARPWDEVRPELERLGIKFVVRETKPRGRVQALGAARVVRVRGSEPVQLQQNIEASDGSASPPEVALSVSNLDHRLEFVLACEIGTRESEVGGQKLEAGS